jgi:hypothetical protein
MDELVHQLKVACGREILKHLLEAKLMEKLLIAEIFRIVFLNSLL